PVERSLLRCCGFTARPESAAERARLYGGTTVRICLAQRGFAVPAVAERSLLRCFGCTARRGLQLGSFAAVAFRYLQTAKVAGGPAFAGATAGTPKASCRDPVAVDEIHTHPGQER